MADFISVPFYDLLQEDGHVPVIREQLPPLLAGVRGSVLEIGAGTGLIWQETLGHCGDTLSGPLPPLWK